MDTEWLSVLDGAGDVGVGHTAYGGGLDFVLELPPFDDVFTLHSRGPQQLRCLDAKHPAECPLCTPAPSWDRHGEYELTEKGGTKALRALVLATPEWASEFARNAVADQVEVEGDPGKVAPVLRRKCARELKKVHLLDLCFRWGYKSCIWVLREGGLRRRARRQLREDAALTAAAAPQQQQLVLSAALLAPDNRRLPTLIDGHCVRDFVDVTMAAFLSRSAALLEGPAARDLAVTRGVAYFQPVSLQEYRTMAEKCSSLATTWTAAGVAQRDWTASVLGAVQLHDLDATCAAWQVLPLLPKAEPVDVVLQQLQDLLATGERMRVAVYRGQVDGTFSVVANELKEAVHQGLQFLSTARLLRAQLASSGLNEYTAAADQLLEVLISYAAATAESYRRRLEWSAATIGNGVQMVNMHSEALAQFAKEFEGRLALDSRVAVHGSPAAASVGTLDVLWSRPARGSSATEQQPIVC